MRWIRRDHREPRRVRRAPAGGITCPPGVARTTASVESSGLAGTLRRGVAHPGVVALLAVRRPGKRGGLLNLKGSVEYFLVCTLGNGYLPSANELLFNGLIQEPEHAPHC